MHNILFFIHTFCCIFPATYTLITLNILMVKSDLKHLLRFLNKKSLCLFIIVHQIISSRYNKYICFHTSELKTLCRSRSAAAGAVWLMFLLSCCWNQPISQTWCFHKLGNYLHHLFHLLNLVIYADEPPMSVKLLISPILRRFTSLIKSNCLISLCDNIYDFCFNMKASSCRLKASFMRNFRLGLRRPLLLVLRNILSHDLNGQEQPEGEPWHIKINTHKAHLSCFLLVFFSF